MSNDNDQPFVYEDESTSYTDPREPGVIRVEVVGREPWRERAIPSLMNPRLSAFRAVNKARSGKGGGNKSSTSGAITLYHFTAAMYLPSILEQGLNRGSVTIGPRQWDYFNNAVWFTEAPNGMMPFEDAPNIRTSKNRIRLSVDLKLEDRDLWRWRDLATYLALDEKMYAALDKTGGNMADRWWVYANRAVPVSHITQVTDMADGEDITKLVLVGTRPNTGTEFEPKDLV